MSGRLAGRVAVITGAGRGIGREHALFFAREGAKVVVNPVSCTSPSTHSVWPLESKVPPA